MLFYLSYLSETKGKAMQTNDIRYLARCRCMFTSEGWGMQGSMQNVSVLVDGCICRENRFDEALKHVKRTIPGNWCIESLKRANT